MALRQRACICCRRTGEHSERCAECFEAICLACRAQSRCAHCFSVHCPIHLDECNHCGGQICPLDFGAGCLRKPAVRPTMLEIVQATPPNRLPKSFAALSRSAPDLDATEITVKPTPKPSRTRPTSPVEIERLRPTKSIERAAREVTTHATAERPRAPALGRARLPDLSNWRFTTKADRAPTPTPVQSPRPSKPRRDPPRPAAPPPRARAPLRSLAPWVAPPRASTTRAPLRKPRPAWYQD